VHQSFYTRVGAIGINRFGLALNVVGADLGKIPAKVQLDLDGAVRRNALLAAPCMGQTAHAAWTDIHPS
jgi:hypothetical protein